MDNQLTWRSSIRGWTQTIVLWYKVRVELWQLCAQENRSSIMPLKVHLSGVRGTSTVRIVYIYFHPLVVMLRVDLIRNVRR